MTQPRAHLHTLEWSLRVRVTQLQYSALEECAVHHVFNRMLEKAKPTGVPSIGSTMKKQCNRM